MTEEKLHELESRERSAAAETDILIAKLQNQ